MLARAATIFAFASALHVVLALPVMDRHAARSDLYSAATLFLVLEPSAAMGGFGDSAEERSGGFTAGCSMFCALGGCVACAIAPLQKARLIANAIALMFDLFMVVPLW